jgi:peptide/nickel transport system substrate-binding protein
MNTIEELYYMVEQGKISRRQFIIQASVLGLSVATSSFLLPDLAKASSPKKGGVFRIGMDTASTSDSLNPHGGHSYVMRVLSNSLMNNLVEIDTDFNAVPELAESFEPSGTADKWMFKLRKGVEFHNGKTLTADDVIYSIDLHRKKEKSKVNELLKPITRITKEDPYSIVFELSSGDADFPYLLADYNLHIVPSDTSDTDWDKGIGTGGYILREWQQGVKYTAVRNPNYFKTGRAHFDEIELIGINGPNSRINALKTGKVDFINRLDKKVAHLMKMDPNMKVVSYPGIGHWSYDMNMEVEPYNDPDVRKALKYAIDRESMVKHLLFDHGTVGNDQPISPIMNFYNPNLPQTEYDPDKAKFHLRKAGLEGHKFVLHASNEPFTECVDSALLYREQAAKAGIIIEVKREPDDAYYRNIFNKKPFVALMWSGRATCSWMLALAYQSGSKYNDTKWSNAHFDELLINARAELDEAKRGKMFGEMQQMLHEDGGAVIPVFVEYVEAASTRLAHGKLGGAYEMDGQRITERWWFES